MPVCPSCHASWPPRNPHQLRQETSAALCPDCQGATRVVRRLQQTAPERHAFLCEHRRDTTTPPCARPRGHTGAHFYWLGAPDGLGTVDAGSIGPCPACDRQIPLDSSGSPRNHFCMTRAGQLLREGLARTARREAQNAMMRGLREVAQDAEAAFADVAANTQQTARALEDLGEALLEVGGTFGGTVRAALVARCPVCQTRQRVLAARTLTAHQRVNPAWQNQQLPGYQFRPGETGQPITIPCEGSGRAVSNTDILTQAARDRQPCPDCGRDVARRADGAPYPHTCRTGHPKGKRPARGLILDGDE
jgi:hypothetical protein